MIDSVRYLVKYNAKNLPQSGLRELKTGKDSLMHLTNYLFFTTACEQALSFYAMCGIGEIVEMKRHGDHGEAVSSSMRGKVMHAFFKGEGVAFYASDNQDAEPMRGSAMMFTLSDQTVATALFSKMANGGVITTPLDIQPWGDLYGKLTDKFGVQWMFNCTMDKPN
jgi:PhnB protein